ncbi:GGDEF domain [Gulbenkiania indica]|uniref:GGDEF domain n=1 Tax=Gulbenkiania indica TaxID=375574 RepID=A0A0K6GSC5_9NEIS|nr:diguanylate cyclase [Gulbenkiania indica]CUA81600.1 GGDEF domain [Gulbenkiania indica]
MISTTHTVLFGQPAPELEAASALAGQLTRHDQPVALGPETHVVLLNPQTAEAHRAWLYRLRSDGRGSQVLIFSLWPEAELDADSRELLDGSWPGATAAAEAASRWAGRQTSMQLSHPDEATQRVLGFLFARDRRALTPVPDWQAPLLYRYPVLDTAAGAGTPAMELMQRLRRRNLLAPSRLVDRVRTCPACHHAHVSYVDRCPVCHALDIEQTPAIHCFTCGFVAPQERFRRQGVLECPNCQTRLRHIGADYDRPMENYHCNACNELFVEPEVVARCLECSETHTPEDLAIQPIEVLELTEEGQLLCRHGQLLQTLVPLSTLEIISPDLFRFTLRWTDLLAARYPQQGYSLLALYFANVPQLIDAHGYARTNEILEGLAERLREYLRSTDLVTRTDDNLYWMLFPNTDLNGMAALRQKLETLLTDLAEGTEPPLVLHLASHTSPAESHAPTEPEVLMEVLASEVTA